MSEDQSSIRRRMSATHQATSSLVVQSVGRRLSFAVLVFAVLYFYTGFGTFTAFNNLPLPRPAECTIALAIIGLTAFLLEAVNGRLHSYPWRILVCALSYSALVLLSMRLFPSADPTWTIKRLGFGITFFGLVFIIGASVDFGRVISLIRFAVVLCCAINIGDYFFSGYIPYTLSLNVDRAAGFFGNANNSALRIAFMLPLVAYALRRHWRYALYGIIFIGLLLTFSRSGFILFVAAVFLTETFMTKAGPINSRTAVAAGSAVALLLLLYVLWPVLSTVIIDVLGDTLNGNTASRLTGDTSDAAAVERVYAAQASWYLFRTSPWIGTGIGIASQTLFGGAAHNMILQMLAELGAIGGLWLTAFIASIWVSGPRFGPICAVMWVIATSFNHNLLDDPGMGLLVAPYVVAAALCRSDHSPRIRRISTEA